MAEVQVYPDSEIILPRGRLLEEVSRCDILYCLLHDRVDREVVDAGQRLRLIACSAINPANVDVARATERGIPVTVIPNIVAETTADLQWALLLAVARRVVEADRALRAGMFPGSQSQRFVGAEVHGKTLGTIGLGAIGRGTVYRARGFGMRVVYTKRQRLLAREEKALGVRYPGTHHLIGAKELSLMKPTAYLINTARGPIVDEAALAEALRADRIAGAALDVYEREPEVTPALKELPNVVLTPHIGSAARDTREQIAHIVVDNIVEFLAGRRPHYLANPEVFERTATGGHDGDRGDDRADGR
jgi:glyoxylate reductase